MGCLAHEFYMIGSILSGIPQHAESRRRRSQTQKSNCSLNYPAEDAAGARRLRHSSRRDTPLQSRSLAATRPLPESF